MSTVLTVGAQTLRRTGSGRHTIATEFFRDKNQTQDQALVTTLKRPSKPYELNIARNLDIMG